MLLAFGGANANDSNVLIGLRLLLILAVLPQYAAVRVCALERVALGVNCHDFAVGGTHASHGDEHGCGTDGRGGGCVCERPTVVGHHQPAQVVVDWQVHGRIAPVVHLPVCVAMHRDRDAEPERCAVGLWRLPLLI